MVHISQLDVKRTERVTDVVNVGDSIMVMVEGIDEKGRLNLSRREALIKVKGMVPENTLPERGDRERRPRRDDYRRDDRRDDRRPRRNNNGGSHN